tara:strand:+ start:362 stop:1354 length:993 start_codon:yes stop_codon:yes gene_type:complete
MNQVKIIAEVGSTHDGSFGNACKSIELLAELGVDAVKFQTHIAEAETIRNAPQPSYFSGEPRFEYFQRTAFSEVQWKEIANLCKKLNVEFISSPFSLEAVDLLEKVGMDSYKIPSGEVTNLPLLEKIKGTNKPVLLSSGMSNWAELNRALEVFGNKYPLVLLQCSSQYPCQAEHVGLNVMSEMKKRFNVDVGFSDHTLGMAASISAVALGATVIEKHFTFSKYMYGSDAKHSMEPSEFQVFMNEIRFAERILHSPVDKNNIDPYLDMKKVFEKSIVAKVNLSAGTILEIEHLSFKKPGDGISASSFKDVLGKRIKRDLCVDEQLKESDLE